MLQEFLLFGAVRSWLIALRQKLAGPAPKRVVIHLGTRESEQLESRGEAGMKRQVVERRQKLSPRQVARGAEHHDGAWIVGNLAIVGIVSRRFGDLGGLRTHGRSP